MITVKFDKPGLNTNLFVIKVSYNEVIGVNEVLETKLSLEQVASVLAAYKKDTYKLTITPTTRSKGIGLPGGYYETFSIDTVASHIKRLRFVRTITIEEPKVVFVTKTVTTEL